MKLFNLDRIIFSAVLLLFILRVSNGQPTGRENQNFNFNWKFFKGDQPGAEKSDYNDSGWRTLDLPHDWSIEGPFSNGQAAPVFYRVESDGTGKLLQYPPE
jgi:beta-galactosidase